MASQRWADLTSLERFTAFSVVAVVVIQATALSFAVELDGPGGQRSGIVPWLAAMLFNVELPHAHIVSQPLLWVARLTVVVLIGLIFVLPILAHRRQRRRRAEAAEAEA